MATRKKVNFMPCNGVHILTQLPLREVNENFDQEPAFYLLEVSWDEQRE